MVTKRIKKMAESVRKTHKEVERQGLPRVTIGGDEKLDEDKEEPKHREKQTANEKEIGISLKMEMELNKTQTVKRKLRNRQYNKQTEIKKPLVSC